jgi:transposase
MARRSRKKKETQVEGFRVLTLTYSVSKLPSSAFQRLVELFKAYRAVSALCFWSRYLSLDAGVELALERARRLLPYYYRKAFDEGSPLYQFNEVEKMKRPRKAVLQLPLETALHPNHGAFIEGGKLVVRLGGGQRLELPLPERALKWLQEKEREVAPLKVAKTVRIQWREDRPEYLKVQIVLRVERPRPERPDPERALLCYVDVNSNYGVVTVLALHDGAETRILETPKLKPPNRGRRLKAAARRKAAAAYGSKRGVNLALARLSERFDARGWVKSACAKIFKRARERARGRPILMNFDVPRSESVRNSYLQRTLLSVKRVAENLSNWYGVHTTFKCHSSSTCPYCGSKLEVVRTRRVRVAYCTQCGFFEDRDFVPFYHWLKTLNLPLSRHPLQRIELPEELRRKLDSVRPGSPPGGPGQPVGGEA